MTTLCSLLSRCAAMTAHVALVITALVACGTPLVAAASDGQCNDNSASTWCRNNEKDKCCPTCGQQSGTESGGNGSQPGCQTCSSAIFNATLTFMHWAVDYKTSSPSGRGCSPCGSTAGADMAGLPSLSIHRIHRYRFGMLHSSFGPNGYQFYDMHLEMWPGVVRVYDPTLHGEWTFDIDPENDGTYDDYEDKGHRGITLYTAGGAVTAVQANAAKAVLVAHDGTAYTFEFVRIDADPASTTRVGRLIAIADRSGNSLSIAYAHAAAATDTQLGGDRTRLWQMATITDAYGKAATVSYRATKVSGDWAISSIAAPTGTISYAYGTIDAGDGAKEALTSVTYPDGAQTSITGSYDSTNQTAVVTFDDAGAETTHRRKSVHFTRTTWTNPTTGVVEAAIANRVRMVVNGTGEVTYVNRMWNDPADGNREQVLVRTGSTQVLAVRFENGNPTRTRRAKTWTWGTDPATWTWETVEDNSFGNFQTQSTRTDNENKTTTYSRDDAGWPTGITYPDATTEVSVYNLFKEATYHRDRLGRQTYTTYDAAGNRLTEAVGTIASGFSGVAAPATRSWTYWQAADSHAEKGKPGQLKTAVDANGNITEYFYVASGYLKRIVEPADVVGGARGTTTFEYDSVGRLWKQTDQGGRLRIFAYDSRNRLTTITYPDASTEQFVYVITGSKANLLKAQRDRNGNWTSYDYDDTGRRVRTVTGDNDNDATNSPPAVAAEKICTYLPGTERESTCLDRGETTTWTYDFALRPISVARKSTSSTTLTSLTEFDPTQRMARTTDPYGRRTFYVYDINDRIRRTVWELIPNAVTVSNSFPQRSTDLLALTRSTGANPTFIIEDMLYDAEGQTTARTDGRGNVTTWDYDAQGRRLRQTEPTVGAQIARTEWSYDAQGNIIEQRHPRHFTEAGGFKTTMTYTGRNLLKTTTEGAGTAIAATSAQTYSLTGKVATATDARNLTTIYGYGVCCDRLTSLTDPAGYVTAFGYDAFGNRTTVTDGNNLTTVTTYDARHRVATITNAAGEVTAYTYDDNLTDGVGLEATYAGLTTGLGLGVGADGSAVAMTNPTGETSVQAMDGLGRTVRTRDALAHQSTTVYDAVVTNLVETAMTDANANTTRQRADGAGRVRVMVDALGNVATAGYDPNGNRVTWRDANGVGQDCIFDARNRDTTCTDTAGAVTTKSYDANSNVVSATDALLAVSTVTFDARDRKVTSTDRINATTDFGYDAVSNLVFILDAEGGQTDYQYNNRNLLSDEQFPTGQQGRTRRVYVYDGGRRLSTRTVTTLPGSSLNEVTTYAYDNANRLKTRAYQDGKNDGFGYDLASRLTSAFSGRYATSVTRAYDAAGRLTTEQQRIPEGTINQVAYAYDNGSRVTSVTYPSGRSVTTAYTARNEPRDLWFAGARSASRSYDAGGRLLTTTYGNALIETRGYVPGDNLVQTISIPSVTGFTYTYDANKRKTRETDSVQSGATQAFGYDLENRLATWGQGATPTAPNLGGGAPTGTTTQTWTLAPVGDWLSTSINGVPRSATFSRVHEQLTFGATSLSYDGKGNLTVDQSGQVFTWDPENRMATARVSDSVEGVSDTAKYVYDALGRRLQKTVWGRTTTFIHDGARAIEEVDTVSVVSATEQASDGTLANLALTPPGGGILSATSSPVRVNVQPATRSIPDGFIADKGRAYGVRTNGKSYGWSTTVASLTARAAHPFPQYDTFGSAGTRTWEYALPNGQYPVVVVMGDALSQVHTNNAVIEGQTFTDPDDKDHPVFYRLGDFDGYAATVTISDGKLTIAMGAGAFDPTLCFVEIGPVGTSITAADQTRLAAQIEAMSARTGGAAFPAPQATPRAFVHGSYVDEVLSYVGGSTRYFAHSNHLYSVAALTDNAGAVTERFKYDAYGKQTILDPVGAVRVKSVVGWNRGYTGYIADQETGLYHARARMYSSILGRFTNRDPWGTDFYVNSHDGTGFPYKPFAGQGYPDGWNSYGAYFIPNGVDPSGTDFLDCWVACVEDNDPIDMALGFAIAALAAAPIPKSIVAGLADAVGLEQLARTTRISMNMAGASQFTSLPSALSAAIRAGSRSTLRAVGAAAARYVGPVVIAYGLALAAAEAHCTGVCTACWWYDIQYDPSMGMGESLRSYFE